MTPIRQILRVASGATRSLSIFMLSPSILQSSKYRLWFRQPFTTPQRHFRSSALSSRLLRPWSSPRLASLLEDPVAPPISVQQVPRHRTDAGFEAENSKHLAALLKEWNDADRPNDVVTRFESVFGTPTTWDRIDSALALEYLKALASGDHSAVVMSPPVSFDPKGFSSHVSQSPRASDFPPEFRLKLDETSQPLEVSIKQLTKSHSVLREMLKYGLTALLTIAAISVMVEGAAANIPRGLGLGAGHKIQAVSNTDTCFQDVKGCDEVKEELQEIVSYLTDPEKFTRLGAKLPKGVLLSGPPGTGKTLLARAIAGEAKVPFIQASGSEFEEMFVGVGARRIRDLFAAARRMAPAIVFIDEIDAVGSKRVNKENTSVRMTLNQLLIELDGFEQTDGVVVICATNFPESLDSALTRPGRLDKTVVVPLPDLQGRKEILDLYGSRVVLHPNVDLSILARRTAGMTGADLFNIINIAAVKGSIEGQASISMEALEAAFDRVVVGLERRNPMSEEERQMTAYHEAGHALVSWHSKLADPVHKVTIMPRGESLGITWQIPRGDRYQEKACELEARLAVLMGGKAAEVMMYGSPNATAGCTSDLKSATTLAREMVTHLGMGVPTTNVPMFIDAYTSGNLAEETRQKIDTAVQNLLDTAYERAASILSEHQDQLKLIADALLEFETISYDEMQMVLEGRKKEIPDLRRAARNKAQKRNDTSRTGLLGRLSGIRSKELKIDDPTSAPSNRTVDSSSP